MSEESREEERRYEEAGRDEARTLDSRVLNDPVPVLKPKAAVVAGPDENVLDVVKQMASKHCGCALVVENKQLVGIFTERDALTRVLSEGREASSLTMREVMTPDPERLVLGDTLGFALHKMSVGSFRNLPIVDDRGLPAGVVSQQDGVRYLVGFFPSEIISQPPRTFEQRPPKSQYGG